MKYIVGTLIYFGIVSIDHSAGLLAVNHKLTFNQSHKMLTYNLS